MCCCTEQRMMNVLGSYMDVLAAYASQQPRTDLQISMVCCVPVSVLGSVIEARYHEIAVIGATDWPAAENPARASPKTTDSSFSPFIALCHSIPNHRPTNPNLSLTFLSSHQPSNQQQCGSQPPLACISQPLLACCCCMPACLPCLRQQGTGCSCPSCRL